MIVVSILATYVVTLMLTSAEGPFGVFARLRNHLNALNCFLCTSVWVGAFVAMCTADGTLNWFVLALGLSGGAVLLDCLTMERTYIDGKQD